MFALLALLLAPPAQEVACHTPLPGETRLAKVVVVRASFTAEPVPAQPGARPYVVKGDTVLIGPTRGGYVPAFFPGASGARGCLPATAIRALPVPPEPKPSDWLGDWMAINPAAYSASFTVERRDAGLHIHGFASWTPRDNPMGLQDDEIDETGIPQGTKLALSPGEDCGYEMQLLGRFLIVSEADGEKCVRTHATFSGIYVR